MLPRTVCILCCCTSHLEIATINAAHGAERLTRPGVVSPASFAARASSMTKRSPHSRHIAPRMAPSHRDAFNVERFLDSAGVNGRVVEYQPSEVIFVQDHACDHVLYLQHGMVKLSVVSHAGAQAIVTLLNPGEFFGEGCLTGQPTHLASAAAVTHSRVLAIAKDEMLRVLHTRHEMSDRFIAHLLTRRIRIEEDLVDQLLNSTEKRLARALLLLAQRGGPTESMPNHALHAIPPISQETLAEMIGTTRSRVNVFIRQFEQLGLIDRKDGLRVNHSLLSGVLHKP